MKIEQEVKFMKIEQEVKFMKIKHERSDQKRIKNYENMR